LSLAEIQHIECKVDVVAQLVANGQGLGALQEGVPTSPSAAVGSSSAPRPSTG
jgi:hypothetical protein